MKKNSILMFVFSALVLIFVVSCASTKDIETTMKVKTKESVVVDWANRNLGIESVPGWINSLMRGNADVFKNDFSIDNSYVIKYGIASGKTKDLAMAASRVNYNAMRAEELRTKVVSEAAATLNDDGKTDAIANAAMVAKVDLSGHELVTQFWQEIATHDENTGLNQNEFICYSVYKITKENWLQTLKTYMKSVLPSLPDSDSKKKMAETITSLYDDTTSNTLKSEEETIAEINAKQDAIKASTQNVSSPAPNANDIEWLNVLETACNIIF